MAMAVLVASAGCGGGKEPAWSPERADLLFTSNRDGNGEIYLLRAGSSEWVNLTNHPDGDNWPEWSPDGTRIVFQSRRSGNLDIWAMGADGSDPVQLTQDPEPDYLPSWKPDGSAIVFTSWRQEAGDSTRAPHVYIMKPDGSEPQRLIAKSLETSSGATWSPDGTRLVFSRKSGEETAALHVARVEGGVEARISEGSESYDGSPVFSPDGRWIAFYADRGDPGSDIAVCQPNGTGRRIVVTGGKAWYPRWSPDGRWLLYTAVVPGGDGSNLDLFAVRVDEPESPQPLVVSPGREVEGRWRPGAARRPPTANP